MINKEYVLKFLDDHCKGKDDFSRKIWTVLMFMVWHQVYVEEKYSFEKVTDNTQVKQLSVIESLKYQLRNHIFLFSYLFICGCLNIGSHFLYMSNFVNVYNPKQKSFGGRSD